MKDVLWVVEMLDNEGNTHGQVIETNENLGNYVRVNGNDAVQYRISQCSVDSIVRLVWAELDEDRFEYMSFERAESK